MPSKMLRIGARILTRAGPFATATKGPVRAVAAIQSASFSAQAPTSPYSRPRIPCTQAHAIPFSAQQKRNIFIQTEPTPNADALKFRPNHPILPADVSLPYIEYLSLRSTISPPYPSPLASKLMAVDGVTSVFYGADFITVTKAADANWAHIRPEVFALITEAITAGETIVNVSSPADKEAAAIAGESQGEEKDSLAYDENDTEVVGMIKELLETRIRPAIQEDGGDIEFCGFEGGQVLLKLRGACRTCDSSTVTLKDSIERMLTHYIEEVEGVTQVLSQEEEVAMQEFAKFEEMLKAQKGANAT